MNEFILFVVLLLLSKCLNFEASPTLRQQTIVQPIKHDSHQQQTSLNQTSLNQRQTQIQPDNVKQVQQPNHKRPSNDARIIFPTEDTIILSNSSSLNYLINKNGALINNTRNSKNVDSKAASTPSPPLEPTIDQNLTIPDLSPNGKPRCLTESNFYCEDVSNYPK